MSENRINISPPPSVIDQQRDCPRGHGGLRRIDHIAGKKAFVLLTYAFENEPIDNAQHIGPFFWFLCPTCGYTELVDTDPSRTINHVSKHG